MSDLYAWIKIVHIVSATLLFGTGLGTAFQMWMAHRSGDARTIAVVARNVVWADWIFTTPAVILQPATGFILVGLGGYGMGEPWLIAAYALYLLVGVCWLPVVWIQWRVRNVALAASASGAALPGAYFVLMRWWFWLGWPAFLGVLAIFWLMVTKPGF